MLKNIFLFLLLGVTILCMAQQKNKINTDTQSTNIIKDTKENNIFPEDSTSSTLQISIVTVEAAEPEDVTEDKPFLMVEQMPSFPGGNDELMKYIRENLRYPDSDACVEGRVIVRFVVDKNGDIQNPVILRSLEHLFDKEAIRVIKESPRWTPGMQNGKAVPVYYTLPIAFKLTKEETDEEE